MAQLFFELWWKPQEFATSSPKIDLSLHIASVRRFPLLGEAQHLDRVSDQISLHLLIDRRIGAKTGTMINLQKIRLALAIHHDVEPKNVKAHRVLVVVWLN